MTSNYEHTIIARQDTSASQIKQIKQKYSDFITKNKGDVVQTQEWGIMNLSYLIKKNKKGNYIHFKIKCDGNLIKELENLANKYLGELSDVRFTLEFIVSNDKLNVQITDNGNVVDIPLIISIITLNTLIGRNNVKPYMKTLVLRP